MSYNLLLYRIDLSKPSVIHVDFLCLYFFNLTILHGMCLFFAHLIKSCKILQLMCGSAEGC